jgi:hypothetical protein
MSAVRAVCAMLRSSLALIRNWLTVRMDVSGAGRQSSAGVVAWL